MKRDVHVACHSSDPRHVVLVSNRPAYECEKAEEHTWHENKPEFGLVDPMIPLRHPDDDAVIDYSGASRKDNPDKTSQVR